MPEATLDDEDYIIGANAAEIRRLGLQHALWREASLGAFRRARIQPGMTVLDLGCGPGYASFDLSRLVGPLGRVIAVDQSRIFLDALEEGAAARKLHNIETVQASIADFDWPVEDYDAVWSRWVLSFLPDPDSAIAGIHRALKPGGVFLAQEYIDYRTFRIEPADPVFERFVDAVEKSWRHFQGDPNIGRRFTPWFSDLGWIQEEMQPEVHVATPADPIWRWPESWLEEAPARLVELGFLSMDDAEAFSRFVAERAGAANTMIVTPMVVSARARKPLRG